MQAAEVAAAAEASRWEFEEAKESGSGGGGRCIKGGIRLVKHTFFLASLGEREEEDRPTRGSENGEVGGRS